MSAAMATDASAPAATAPRDPDSRPGCGRSPGGGSRRPRRHGVARDRRRVRRADDRARGAGPHRRRTGREAGVNYAPPSFIGPAPGAEDAAAISAAAPGRCGDLSRRRSARDALPTSGPSAPASSQHDRAARAATRCRSAATSGAATSSRRRSRARETSIFVGCSPRCVATLSARCSARSPATTAARSTTRSTGSTACSARFPASAADPRGRRGAAAEGTLTIILILGLTGWTGMFRLIRAEYLKHKAREYVQAADAIGASNARACSSTSSRTSATSCWCSCRSSPSASSRPR